ncbi:MAG: hypothetical protein ACI4E1_00135 [Lachnospira sp.]
MLNENKVKMMTKMAIYEKNKGKRMIKTAKYFKGDYITFGVLKTLITTTIAFIIIIGLYVLCDAEGMVKAVSRMGYADFATTVAFVYVFFMIIMTCIAILVYRAEFVNTREGLKRYFSRLNKLERFYNRQKKNNK